MIFSTPGYDVREILESYQEKLWLRNYFFDYIDSEGVVLRILVKKVFIEISQNSQENTCARVSCRHQLCSFIKKDALPQVFSCEFCEISKNTFPHRTPPVAAFVDSDFLLSILYYYGGIIYPWYYVKRNKNILPKKELNI